MLSTNKLTALAGLVVVLCGAAVYANSLEGPFLFDDLPSIRDNPNIRRFSPSSEALWGPAGSGSNGRPLVALSLAVNYALGGLSATGYHLFNVGVHLLCGLALFGVARRTAKLGLALAIALVWVVHPLTTDALNHVIYRNEAMMSLFFLGTLYAAARGFRSRKKSVWFALAAGFALASVLSKEVAVAIPVVCLLYDRTFFSETFANAWRSHKRLHVALFATWIPLALLVAAQERGESVGMALEGFTPFEYLFTQAGALLLYLKLSVFPYPLVIDYHDWPIARSFADAALPMVAIAVLVLASIVSLARRQVAGFLGVAFFCVLAPTSSIVPLAGEVVAEHRMYLPLTGVVALIVLGLHRALEKVLPEDARRRPIETVLTLAAACALGWTTHTRNEDYSTRVAIWQDTVNERPGNARAHNSLGAALAAAGRKGEAEAAYLAALAIDPRHAKAHNNLANLYSTDGKLQEAERHFRDAIASNPSIGEPYGNLATLLLGQDRLGEADRLYAEGVERAPASAELRLLRGELLLYTSRGAEGLDEIREAMRLKPRWRAPRIRYAWHLATAPEPELRDAAEALRITGALILEMGPRLRLLDTHAAALAAYGRFDEAQIAARDALELATSQRLFSEIEARRELYASGRVFQEKRR